MSKHQSAREVNTSSLQVPAVPPVTTMLQKPKGKILKEVIEKREKYVKHFFKDDLTFEAAIYKDAVHYYSEGKWKDIDNSLIDGKDSDNNDVLENKSNNFKVKIGKVAKTQNFITITKEQYEVTWGIDKAKGVAGKVKPLAQTGEVPYQRHNKKNKNRDEEQKRQIIQDQNAEKITLTNISSMVEFLDLSTGVDFNYEIRGDKFKESIIIKEKMSTPSFIYNLSVKNLVPVLQVDESILFYDDKDSSKVIFLMKPPYMYDGKGIVSKDVQVTLTKVNSEYKLSYIPSEEWLNDKDRLYPVIIDPYIGTPLGVTSIEDSFIGSKIPKEIRQITDRLGVGLGLSSGITRSYIRFTLPVLKSGDMIINAQLRLFLFTANSDLRQINVHQVTQDWHSGSITWDTPAQFNQEKIEDYQIVQGNMYDLITWDVTSIAKDWYNTGNNYGLMLKNEDETVGYNEFVASDATVDESRKVSLIPYRPQVILTYVNNSGLESYWTYHSQDVRRAGIGYINDYNGNVIFVHNDISMSGNKMPLTLKHVFNSNDKDDITLKYGPGWRLNVSQRVENFGIIDGIQWYKFTDENGTKHYFYYDSASASYKEEMGLDLTFTINADGGYTIKDKSGGALVFVPGGYLHEIKDKNNNTITLSYNGIILTTITDGSGRVTTLDVLSNGYLIGIIDPSGRRTSFAYTGIQLTKITYPDGKYTTFTYESLTSNTLISITNYDGYKITYTYYPVAPYRVKKVEEFGTDGLAGGSLNISYGYNSTTFIDAKNRKNVYQFNNYGNTVSIRDDDGSAGYYKYMSGDFSNKLSLESKLQKYSKNYLRNHNVEASSDWTIYNEPGSTGSSSYTTEDKYLGIQSIKIIKTNNITKYSYTQPVTLVKGNTYNLSGYIKTNEISNTNGLGAMLEIVYQDANSAWLSVNSQYINGTNDWQRVEVKFTLPLDSVSGAAYAKFGIAGETGRAYFDCLQFEDGPIASRYNIVENSDLSYGQPIPNYWSKNALCDSNDISTAIDGKMTFRINGSATKTKNMYQTVQVSGNTGDVFLLSGWAKGASAPISGSRRFSLEVGFKKLDDTYDWHIISFNEDSSDWQYITDRILAVAAYKSVTLYAEYYYNVNTAYFTDFQLCKEEFGASYSYDSKGNVTSIEDISKQKSTFEYDGNNDLVKATSPAGSSFVYVRDANRNITQATSATNVVYTFTYDGSGNPLTSKVGDTSLFMESTATYTLSGNYLETLTDSEGNTITSQYDEARGVLVSITDAKGNETSYVYDSMDRITSVSKVVASAVSRSFEEIPLTTDTTVNLITNASFEGSISSWTLEDWNNSTGKWRLSPEGVDGSNCLECYDSDGLTDGSATNAVAYQLITMPTVLNSQKEYTLSAYTKKSGTDNPILGIRCFSANGGEITGSYKNYENVIVQNQWIRISNAFNFPSGTKSFFVILRSNVRDSNTVKFAEVQLEEKSMDVLNATSSRSNSELYSRTGVTVTNNYTYENDRIKTIAHNGFSYSFQYDALGRNTKVFVGNASLPESQILIENTFEQSTGNLLQSIYGGNATQKINIDYDNLDRVISRKFNDVERYKYEYDNSGNLGYHEDKVNDKSYIYTYDLSDRLVKVDEFSGESSNINYAKFGYDKNNNHSKITQKINGNLYVTKYSYDKDNKPLEVLYGSSSEDNVNVEYFPLSGSTLGSKGTQPVTETPVFQKDENGETVLSAKVGTKVVYNLGINKTSGTMTSWFTETRQSTRMIIANEGTSDQLLNLYVGSNEKVNLAVRNNAGVYTAIITTDETVGQNEWNFVAVKWQYSGSTLTCTLYLNSKAYTANVTDFMDFTGIQTAVGSTVAGSYPLNGLSKKFNYSSSALTENEILSMYYQNIVNYSYDTLGRMTSKTTHTGLYSYATDYAYVDGISEHSTTSKVASIKNNNDDPIAYQYDANGNITKITQGLVSITYYYNELNELIQEDNQVLNKTIIYSYDVGGNLMSKQEIIYGGGGNTTIAYNYDNVWKDKLISYNGKAIEHDAIGNLTEYDGYTYTWEEGRQLKTIVGNGKNISFKYNDAGIRTEKNVDGVITKYYLLGTKVTYETNGTDVIYYTYDGSGDLVSMNLNAVDYYYIRNAQGDIIGLFDKNGTQVVSYVYDSWGKLIATTGTLGATVGVKNMYRYRGYRFDSETGLYYLQSRYYNSEWGRFINADSDGGTIGELLSHNVFAYCKNDPVNMSDYDGHWSLKATLAVIAVVAIVAIAVIAVVVTDGAALVAVGELEGVMAGLSELGAGAGAVSAALQEEAPMIQRASTAITKYNPKFATQQLIQGGKTTANALKSMVSKGSVNKFVPTDTISSGYKFIERINGTRVEIKWHAPDLNAFVKYGSGSNSGTGWTAQITIGKKLVGQDLQFYKRAENITHIPLFRR